MAEYHIRILKPDGRPTLITAIYQFSKDAAICWAQKLANGRRFEVWREMECVYPPDALSTSRPPSTDRPAA
jgi:hypothetical protein